MTSRDPASDWPQSGYSVYYSLIEPFSLEENACLSLAVNHPNPSHCLAIGQKSEDLTPIFYRQGSIECSISAGLHLFLLGMHLSPLLPLAPGAMEQLVPTSAPLLAPRAAPWLNSSSLAAFSAARRG